jgi:hypothetical protein
MAQPSARDFVDARVVGHAPCKPSGRNAICEWRRSGDSNMMRPAARKMLVLVERH